MPTYREIFSYGWGKFRENLLLFVGVVLIIFGVSTIDGFLQDTLRPQLGVWVFLVGLAFMLLNILIQLGFLKIVFKTIDGKRGEFNDLFRHYPLFLNYFAANILTGLIVLLGLILFVIPGIFLAVKLQFAPAFVVDKGAGPIEALRGSWELTRGKWLKLFGFDIIFVVLNLLGAMFFFVGLLVTLPVTVLSYGYLYRKLVATSK